MARKLLAAFSMIFFLCSSVVFSAGWEDPSEWDTVTENDGSSKITLSNEIDGSDKVLKVDYELRKDGHAFVVFRKR